MSASEPVNSLPLNRRTFLQASAAGLAGAATLASANATSAVKPARAKSVIFILMTGGPSQLETFDPKPDAPVDVRGPFKSIETSVPGIRISEHFPRLAQRAHQFSIIRTLNHDALPIHETGLQLIQTGRLAEPEMEFPHAGAVTARLNPQRKSHWCCLPYQEGLGHMGVGLPKGDSGVWLNCRPSREVTTAERKAMTCFSRGYYALRVKDAETFGLTSPWRRDPSAVEPWHDAMHQMFTRAVRWIELIQRQCFFSINMFHSVFNQLSWDMHASSKRLWVSPDTYRRVLCPIFDRCFSNLLDDLANRGLLESTLVVAVGEMGRMPKMNTCGGRDHWTRCWSALIAGGGTQGGRVIGTSDSVAGEPIDRPVSPAELVATIYESLGIDPATQIERPDGKWMALVEAEGIGELV